MNWNKQMEEMVGTWTDMQRQMWDKWAQSVKGFGGPGEQGTQLWQQGYKKNLDAWEQSVHEALNAQAQWTQSWSEQLSADEAGSEATAQWIEQVQEMMKGWTAAQTQLWNAWFESVKHLDASQAAGRWESEGQQVLAAWQEASQRAQDTLAEWSNMVAESGTAATATKAATKKKG